MPDRPLIGISADVIPVRHRCRYSVYNTYAGAVRGAGGFAIGVFPGAPDDVPELLRRVDGLLLPGGDDLHPKHWGEEAVHPKVVLSAEERSEFELRLVREAARQGVPVLGICLGFQTLNVAMGGTIVQHLDPALGHGRGDGTGAEDNIHAVHVHEGTLLRSLLARDRVDVNSGHHQAIGELGRGLRPAATAEDGVVEAIEIDSGAFLLGVQWHPEERRDDPVSRALFEGLVRAAAAAS